MELIKINLEYNTKVVKEVKLENLLASADRLSLISPIIQKVEVYKN